ncbi:hypothetical protein DFH06DRAFT_1477827, partial [Mycena polygramma]
CPPLALDHLSLHHLLRPRVSREGAKIRNTVPTWESLRRVPCGSRAERLVPLPVGGRATQIRTSGSPRKKAAAARLLLVQYERASDALEHPTCTPLRRLNQRSEFCGAAGCFVDVA